MKRKQHSRNAGADDWEERDVENERQNRRKNKSATKKRRQTDMLQERKTESKQVTYAIKEVICRN